MTLMEPYISAKKTLTCTLATAVWTADGSTIPSTESTRWGRTLTAEDFPVWSFPPESVKYICHFFVSIYNTTGFTQTINWKIYKNNISGYNSTKTVSNNNYIGLTVSFYDVSVGDVLELAVWCSSPTNVTVVGSLYHVVPTRLLPTSKPCIDVNTTFNTYSYPSPVSGSVAAPTVYIGNSITYSVSSNSTILFSSLSFISQNSYGLFRYSQGDSSYVDNLYDINSVTPTIRISRFPTTISYRELRL